VVAVVAATAVLVQQPSASARSLDATGALSGTEAECLDAGEVQLLALINSYRTDHGLAALAPSRRLDVSAYRHSEDQATNRYFGVASPDGSSPAERAHDQGYPSAFVGENVSAGRPAVRAVFRSWRADSSSNANLLRPEYRAIGLGHLSQPGSQWFTYWTADFGDIADGGPTCGG
jgi:uncharacterized protein YkwD